MRLIAVVLALMLASSCSSIPRPGFATRYLGGTIGPTMHDAIIPETNFMGAPIGKPYASEFSGTPAVQGPTPVVRGVQITNCTDAATQRARDVRDEGFDRDVQDQVFQTALADCRRWQARAGS